MSCEIWCDDDVYFRHISLFVNNQIADYIDPSQEMFHHSSLLIYYLHIYISNLPDSEEISSVMVAIILRASIGSLLQT